MVTGGYGWEGYLASTEVFSSGAWRTAGALPGPVCYMSAVNFQNRIFTFGGYHSMNALSWILEFDTDTEVWSQIGALNAPRSNYAVTTIHLDNLLQVCNM